VSGNGADIAKSESLRDGSFNYPFIDLEDALTEARELASVYSNTITVRIYLFSGNHYLLRNRGGSVTGIF
jgi:hypothetical protein